MGHVTTNGTESHPSVKALRRFAWGDPDFVEFDFVAAHLEGCKSCTEQVSRMGPSSPLHAEVVHGPEADDDLDAALDITMRALVHDLPRFVSAPDVRPSDYIGRFRTIEIIGEGKNGTVWRAFDAELNREVAVKTLKLERDDPIRREWMLREAQFISLLDHPSIVPVYHLAEGDGGPPFIVMKLAVGSDFGQAIGEYHGQVAARPDRPDALPPWTLTTLLQRLIAVADAVAYAHSRGIMHLDIKPSNVLINSFNETLVADWGLARRAGEPGASPGTEGYRAPEQAAGHPEFRSDVYALGAILGVILSGRRPTESASGEIGFVPPLGRRERLPSAPAALLSVARKATQEQPTDRYFSASAFADDLRAWLLDEPVSAHQEQIPDRSRRWLKRHPQIVALVIAGSIAFVALLATASYLQRRSNLWLQANNEELRKSRDESTRRGDALEGLVEGVAFDVINRLEDIPGALATRKAILQDLAKRFDGLESKVGMGHALDTDLAALHGQLGDLMGDPFRSNLGDFPGALDEYRKALQLLEKVVAAHPEDRGACANLGTVWNKLGNVQRAIGDLKQAIRSYDAGLQVRRSWSLAMPGDILAKLHLAVSLDAIGDAAIADDRAHDADAAYSEALQIREGLEPNPEVRAALAVSLNKLTNLLIQQGNLDEARKFAERSLALREDLIRPDGLDSQRSVILAHMKIGEIESEAKNWAKAVESSNKAITLADRLITNDPDDERIRQLRLAALMNVCESERRLRHFPEAEASNRRAMEDAEFLVKSSPASHAAESFRARAFAHLAAIRQAMALEASRPRDERLRLWRECKTASEQSLEIFDSLKKRGPLPAPIRDLPGIVERAIKSADQAIRELEWHN